MLVIAQRDFVFDGSGILAEMLKDAWFLPLMLGGLAVVTASPPSAALRSRSAGSEGGPARDEGEKCSTNRATRLQTAVRHEPWPSLAAVLFFGGFSHELVHFFVAKGSEGLSAWARKVGGAGGIACRVGRRHLRRIQGRSHWAAPLRRHQAGPPGSRLRSSPSVHHCRRCSCSIVLATGSRALLAGLPGPEEGVVSNLHRALLVAMGVCALFACFEYFSDEGPLLRRIVVLPGRGRAGRRHREQAADLLFPGRGDCSHGPASGRRLLAVALDQASAPARAGDSGSEPVPVL